MKGAPAVQLPLTPRETVTEQHARNQADARALADIHRAQRSKGHRAIIGDYEYFEAESHSASRALYKAPTHNAIDIRGYRCGARYVCGPGMIEDMIDADRACHEAGELADRTGQPVTVWRFFNGVSQTYRVGEQPDPCAVLYTTIGPA
jgi:hypothetical protein